MPKFITSIDDFDAEWEKNHKTEEVEETVEEDEEEIEILDEDALDEVLEEEENLEEEEQDEVEDEEDSLGDMEIKPTKVDKKEFAFSKLRSENKEYKEKVSKLEQRSKELEELATSLGYKNAEEMLEAERKRRIAKEAQDKGIDPTFYQEFKQTQSELERIRRERESEIKTNKLQKFTNELEAVYTEYAFNEKEKADIIQAIEEDGYELDDLLTIKSPKKFILGYANDKIVQREIQKQLKNSNKQNLQEEKFSKGKTKDLQSKIEEEIEKEMRAYAKERGLSYEK